MKINTRNVMLFIAYFLTYVTSTAFIASASYYATLGTLNILPFGGVLTSIASSQAASQNSVRNLLITRIFSSMPESRSPVRIAVIPLVLGAMVLRNLIPPLDRLCNGVGHFFNKVFRRTPSPAETANITLPSFSQFEYDVSQWQFSGNGNLNQRFNINTLNLFGCLIFVLLFIIYFFLFSSLFLYALDKIQITASNLNQFTNKILSGKPSSLASVLPGYRNSQEIDQQVIDIGTTGNQQEANNFININ
uniref:Uncharacterized protein n=1 Tax=Melanthalia intermedia TaxID=172989 RepID=A0A345UB25_9FLOR|nr:hypothetical protein [Melanthalia intermedia]AXI97661.1 hypothetical protein [Melanthalia intermedia]